jgi:hypothetical protein
MAFIDDLPLYYVLDGDIFVKIYRDGERIRAVNHLGMGYDAGKAVYQGVRISKEEYEAGKAEFVKPPMKPLASV